MIPDSITKLADRLSQLPGIGPRQALRLAFYLARLPKSELSQYASGLGVIAQLKECAECFMLHDNAGGLCSICADPKRSPKLLALVEKDTDLLTFEKPRSTGSGQAQAFAGRYLVLGDLKKAGTLEQSHKARLAALRKAAETNGQFDEIIIALSPTATGDLNASLLTKELTGLAKKITRLGRGIPTGGEIEFVDEQTLIDALRHRD